MKLLQEELEELREMAHYSDDEDDYGDDAFEEEDRSRQLERAAIGAATWRRDVGPGATLVHRRADERTRPADDAGAGLGDEVPERGEVRVVRAHGDDGAEERQRQLRH